MLHFPFTSTLALSHFPFSRRVHFCQSLHTIPLALSPQRLAHILLFSLAHPLCARQEEDLLPLVVQVHATGFVCPAAFGLTVTDSGAVGTDCRPGTFRSSSDTCEPCQPGTYSSGYEMAQCTACAPGSYAPAAGAPMCTLCGKGEFLDASGSTESCNMCPLGSHQPLTGQPVCAECPVGSFQVRSQARPSQSATPPTYLLAQSYE
jgi:hypothetical protein